MLKKTPPPKNKKLRYETDKLYRWNLCQRLAKIIYASTLGEHQIEENIEIVLENFSLNFKK